MHVAHQLWDTALLFQGGGSRGMAQFRTGFARPASGQGSWGAAEGRAVSLNQKVHHRCNSAVRGGIRWRRAGVG